MAGAKADEHDLLHGNHRRARAARAHGALGHIRADRRRGPPSGCGRRDRHRGGPRWWPGMPTPGPRPGSSTS
jgi:hypothetical protein